MTISENDNGVMFLAVVDKRFSKPIAFNCLDEIRSEFNKSFDEEETKNAEPNELNQQFSGVLEKAYVRSF